MERHRGDGRGAPGRLAGRSGSTSSTIPTAAPPGSSSSSSYYEEYLDWAEDAEGGPTPAPAPRWRGCAPRCRLAPPQGDAIVWGDSRLGNQIYVDHRVVAVLDWEMVALGDPRIDLGWWLFCDETLSTGSGFARLPGSRRATRPWRAGPSSPAARPTTCTGS